MTAIKLAMGMFGLGALFGDEAMGMVHAARIAEQAGIDQVVFQDHVVMGENTDKYPFGDFPLPPEAPWLEPMMLMSAVAAATETIRISSGVIISPLRPAALLAKMVATLDQLSHGRVDLGVGVGWQAEEYQALGLDFDRRWTLFDDQLRACRKLWTECPVNFDSRNVKLERIYSTPFPVQEPLPLWFGVAATPRQAQRIAELGQGWIPISMQAEDVRRGVDLIKEAFVTAGRDPEALQVRANMRPVYEKGGSNLGKTLKMAEQLVAAGATMLEIYPIHFATSPESLTAVMEQVAGLKS
jgi:probable F420-dependent oxidoreductase